MPAQPSPANPMQARLYQGYLLARARLGPAGDLVFVHLGERQSGMAVGREAGLQPALLVFDLGLQRLAAGHFLRTPPTALSMENAIAAVEDLVMPLHTSMPPGARLVGCDAALHEVAQVAGASATGDAPVLLSLDALERCFNRLVHVVEGRPAAQEGLPDSNAFAAALLVLRECMHHLRFDSITLLPEPLAWA